jgi:capsular polysaccharide biosynthesis protein
MKIHRAKIFGFSLLLTGLALCGAGLWLLLSPAQYRATVTIIVLTDMIIDDVDVQKTHPGGSVYDPYYVASTSERIQSEAVLTNVVAALNLNDIWGRKYSRGNRFETDQTVKLLKKRIRVQTASRTLRMSISVTSEDPHEAATIANAVAKAFAKYRMEKHRQLNIQGIQTLTELYQTEEEEIQRVQTNVNFLRQECKITNDVPLPQLQPEHNAALPGQPYWEEKRKLEKLLDFHKLIAAKIEASKLDLDIPRSPPVEIVDMATPPKSPVGPNRPLGGLLFAVGLFLSVGGLFLLKSSGRPSA